MMKKLMIPLPLNSFLYIVNCVYIHTLTITLFALAHTILKLRPQLTSNPPCTQAGITQISQNRGLGYGHLPRTIWYVCECVCGCMCRCVNVKYYMYVYPLGPKIACKNLLHTVQLLISVHQHLVALLPMTIITAFYNLEGMPRWLFEMIIALGRKRWDARSVATTKEGTQCVCHSFVIKAPL